MPDRYTGSKFHGRSTAVRIIQMPNGRFGLVRAAFKGMHWTERRVGPVEGFKDEAEAEKAGREISP